MSNINVSFVHDSVVVRFPDGHLLSGFHTAESGEVVGEIQQYSGWQEPDSVLERHAEQLRELADSEYGRYARTAFNKMAAELEDLIG